METVGYLFMLVLCAIAGWYFTRPKRPVPGPPGLPVVGNLLSLGAKPNVTMLEWREKYGDTFGFSVGPKLFIVINKYETIKKTFMDEATAGRNILNYCVSHLQRNAHGKAAGLLTSEGDLWTEHRRFAIWTMKDLGMGKTWMEDAILAETDDLCIELAKKNLQPVLPKKLIYHTVSNVIAALVYGKRFGYDHKGFAHVVASVNEMADWSANDLIYMAMPYLKYVPGYFKNSFHGAQKSYNVIQDFSRQSIRDHAEEIKASAEESTDFIGSYLQKSREIDASEKDKKNTFDDFQLEVAVYDLFTAGMETTGTTMMWSFVYMLENPDVMRKVQQEIDDVVGRERQIHMTDKVNLPYTEATILEVQRLGNVVPLGVFHEVKEDTLIDGYKIPKGSCVVPNLYFMHRDPQYWQDSKKFDPTRFLGPDGKTFLPKGFAPFGIGKRACLGELLAKMELFLVFANMMQRFTLRLPQGGTVSSEDYTFGIVLLPKQVEIIFEPRAMSS